MFLVISLSSTVLCYYFEQQALDSIQVVNRDLLTQISETTHYTIDNIKSLTFQIYNDERIAKLYQYTEPDSYELTDAYMQLEFYRNSTPMIFSIYIYNDYTQQIYSSPFPSGVQTPKSFVDKSALALFTAKQKQFDPVCRVIDYAFYDASQEYKSTVYSFSYTGNFNTAAGEDKKAESTMMLNVSGEWLREFIKSQEVQTSGEVCIIDKNGTVVYSYDRSVILSDVSAQPYIQRIMRSKEGQGYFVGKVNGVKSAVSFVSAQNIDWTYIKVSPTKRTGMNNSNSRMVQNLCPEKNIRIWNM